MEENIFGRGCMCCMALLAYVMVFIVTQIVILHALFLSYEEKVL